VERYNHTQPGWVIIVLMSTAVVFFIFAMNSARDMLPGVIGMTVIVLCLGLFYKLTVIIDDKYLRLKFAYGIIRAKFLLEEIGSCKIVKNPWYYGWGIHYLGNGWIFNISGLYAVEITMKNGKVHRVGTDEPEELEKALKSILGH
jgi:hypothetical protein